MRWMRGLQKHKYDILKSNRSWGYPYTEYTDVKIVGRLKNVKICILMGKEWAEIKFWWSNWSVGQQGVSSLQDFDLFLWTLRRWTEEATRHVKWEARHFTGTSLVFTHSEAVLLAYVSCSRRKRRESRKEQRKGAAVFLGKQNAIWRDHIDFSVL